MYNIKENHKFKNISIFALLCPKNTNYFFKTLSTELSVFKNSSLL